MVVVYGRRRVGKAALLNQFISGKSETYYFTAQQTVTQENLGLLSASLASSRTEGMAFSDDSPVYRSFSDAFSAFFHMARSERIIFVIDEYPYLVESYPSVSSLLQALIDENKEASKLFLVLCGSSMNFMEEQVLGEKSLLYGRRTMQVKLNPFDVFDAFDLLGRPDPAKAVELYALAGGVPLYLEQFDARRGVVWNIANRLLSPSSLLASEVESFSPGGAFASKL